MTLAHIVPASAGSLSVAVVALFFTVFQGWLAVERPRFYWNAWGAALSFSAFVYASAVFCQFNVGAGPVNHLSELIQYTAFICVIHSAFGFTFAYLAIPSGRYHRIAGLFHAGLLLMLWNTKLVILDGFVMREFTWLQSPYIEPDLGVLGPAYLLYCSGAGLWALRFWVQHRHREKAGATAFIIGFLIWAVLGVHDALVTLGMRSVLFFMEYGFLGFSAAILSVTLRKYVELYGLAENNHALLQKAHDELESRVTERTLELTRLNLKLQMEVGERRRAEMALKASETLLRKVIDLVPQFVFVRDRMGRFLLANKAVADAYGTSVDELTGKTDADFNPHAADVRHFMEDDRAVMASGQPREIQEERITDMKGHFRLSHTIKIPFQPAAGREDAILCISTDITEQKKAEEERVNLEIQLQRAKKMEALGLLAGGVAHDLNNILSGIVSYPELLLMDLPEGSPLIKPLLIIKSSGDKAARIVQDLLTLARRGVAVKETVDLNSVINTYLQSPEFHKMKTFNPHVAVETHLDPDLYHVSGSPVHLSKAVMNLVSNAVEAMPDGGRVTIQTRNDRQKASLSSSDQINPVDYVRLSVGDQGVGIAPEDQERIFEPFYTKKRMGRSGTGLGMAVVWGTVKDHDGTIEVKSETGQGTTFTIFIPATAKPLAALSERKSLDEIKGNGEKILIIDDVREQRIIATAMLQKLGYQVMAAANGEEALTVVESYDPDLLLLDMIMDPGMDGCETYQKILERRPGQKAVVASGFSESERVAEIQRLGARIYIRKPYAIEVLGLAIQEALAGS